MLKTYDSFKWSETAVIMFESTLQQMNQYKMISKHHLSPRVIWKKINHIITLSLKYREDRVSGTGYVRQKDIPGWAGSWPHTASSPGRDGWKKNISLEMTDIHECKDSGVFLVCEFSFLTPFLQKHPNNRSSSYKNKSSVLEIKYVFFY